MFYLEEYLGDFIFDTFQPFYFFANNTIQYKVPMSGSKDDYISYIDGLPLTNSPDVFGLHTDAEIGYLTNAVKDMWSQLVSLQPRSSDGSGGISREDFISGIASDVQSKLPVLFDISRIAKNIGVPIPTQVVILQELERWNLPVEAMGSSLGKALKREIGMSAKS
jgi:dynein heavy chain